MITRCIEIVIWIVIIGLLSPTAGQSDWRKFVICSDTKDDQTIDCKNGPIYVRSASIVTLQSWGLCDLTNMEPQIETIPSGCMLDDTGVYGICHGKRSCTFNRQMTKAPLGSGQCANGDETNVLFITYSCFDGKDNTATFLPEEGPTVAESFNIFSPFYPCKMPSEEHSFSCTITKNSTRAPSTFALRVELVRLTFGTSAHCWEHLTLSTTGSKAALLRDYCSGEVREIWRRVLPTSVITSLDISYRSKLNMKNEAGLFWIKVENAQAAQDTKLKMSCTSTPTNTSISSIRGCTPFKISSGNNNNNGNTGQTTTVDTTTTTSTFPEITPIVTTSDDSSEISGTVAYVIVAVAIAVIVIIAIVAAICICRRTRKEKEYDKEDTSTTNIHSVTTGYSSEDEIKNGKVTEMHHISSNKQKKKSKATKNEKITEIDEIKEDKPKKKEKKEKTEKKEKESKKEKKEKEPKKEKEKESKKEKKEKEKMEKESKKEKKEKEKMEKESKKEKKEKGKMEKESKKEKKDKKTMTVVAAAAVMHSSDRDSIRREDEFEEIQRHSEVVEEPPRAETPPVHEEPPRSETPSMHDRHTSYVSTTDSTRELIEHQEDISVRPESTVSEIHRESAQPEELSRTNTPILAAPVQGRPASYVDSENGRTSDIEETGSFRPESEIHRESTVPEEVSRTNTPSLLAAQVHGRAASSVADSERFRTSEIAESGSLRPESEINRESVVYEEHSRTPSAVVVPPAPPPPGMQSNGMDDVIDAPLAGDLNSVRESAAMNDGDIIHPEPGYSSVQAASLEPERREYTPLQREENASYTDEINRTSYVPGSNRDSIDYEDTVHIHPPEDEVDREPAYPDEMYAVVDKRKKRESSAIYQSDDTVGEGVVASAYENVEFSGLKEEETIASSYHNRDSDIMF